MRRQFIHSFTHSFHHAVQTCKHTDTYLQDWHQHLDHVAQVGSQAHVAPLTHSTKGKDGTLTNLHSTAQHSTAQHSQQQLSVAVNPSVHPAVPKPPVATASSGTADSSCIIRCTPPTFQSWSANRCCTIGSSSGSTCSSLRWLDSMSNAAAEHLRRFHTRSSSSSSSPPPSSSSASPAAASRARACLLCVGLMSCGTAVTGSRAGRGMR
jgi:hypothetical protein